MAFVSKGGRRIGKLKNEVRNFNLEQRRKVNATARSVAVQIMNDLARKGPEWSGEFKNSWEAVALGEGSKIGKSGSFPYKIGNIPRLSTKKEEIRRANKLQITNTSKSAKYALDIEKGRFSPPNFPRPERPSFNIFLAKEIPHYNLRHIIKPGLSGWAQVNYPYSSSYKDSKNKLSYDLFYISNYSIFLDLIILFKTMRTVLSGKGSSPH